MEEQIYEIESEIRALRQLLTNSDYKTLKYTEGFISEDDYAEIKTFRQNCRDKINEYEAQLEKLEAEMTTSADETDEEPEDTSTDPE